MNFTLPWWSLLRNTAAASIAALGFAILFNVPRRTLTGCALAGALAYAVRTSLFDIGLVGTEAATLIGSTVVSFLGVMLGRVRHVPASVYIVPGVIPLVPGVLAFKTMISVLALATGAPVANETLMIETVVKGLKTVLILGGIAAGVAIPSLLFRRHRPIS